MKKKIILGVTASAAAYKACDLTRLFVKAGYPVVCVLTANAEELVTPLALETLSGNPVYTGTFAWERREMGHIELKENAGLLLIAPATANCIGKFAAGIADDLLSTTYLSVACPVLIAPAMNPSMYSHPAVRENMQKLRSRGVEFVEPGEGTVACGDEGKGRLAEIDQIFARACELFEG